MTHRTLEVKTENMSLLIKKKKKQLRKHRCWCEDVIAETKMVIFGCYGCHGVQLSKVNIQIRNEMKQECKSRTQHVLTLTVSCTIIMSVCVTPLGQWKQQGRRLALLCIFVCVKEERSICMYSKTHTRTTHSVSDLNNVMIQNCVCVWL